MLKCAWQWCLVLVAAVALSGGTRAVAQASDDAAWTDDLPVVVGDGHGWLIAHARDDDDRPSVYIYHARLGEPTPMWREAVRLNGSLARGGLAAAEDQLLLVFADGSVQQVRARSGPIDGTWRFGTRAAAALPSDATIRSLLATDDGAWALVRVESAASLERLDGPASASAANARLTGLTEAEREVRNLVIGLPRNYQPPAADDPAADDTDPHPGPSVSALPAATQPSAQAGEAEEPTEPIITPDDRLVRMQAFGWESTALPDDWPRSAVAALAPGGDAGLHAKPYLLTRPDERSAETWRLYRPSAEDWKAEDLELPSPGRALPVRVGGQLVLVQHHPTQAGFMALFSVVRAGKVHGLGERTIDLPRGGRWTAWAQDDQHVAVAAGSRELADRVHTAEQTLLDAGPTFKTIDLHGQGATSAVVVGREVVSAVAREVDYFILLIVVLSSTLLLFTFWRRDPRSYELALPKGVHLAGLSRRAVAGMIDLTPGLLAGTMLFELPLDALYARWPGRGLGADLNMMLPGLLAIAITVAHTALLETLTARSLGKWLTGLRVATLDGRPPRVWQSLLRCVLKAYDLVAYLLLVLPVISPYRQRLGDMVARTVVVTGTPEPDADADREADTDADTDPDADIDQDSQPDPPEERP